MKLLFLTAIRNRKHYLLILGTMISMILLTIASQLEICSLGVLASKGPDFFELFGPMQEGVVEKGAEVQKDQLIGRWEMIDSTGSGVITKRDARYFLDQHSKGNIVDKMVGFVDDNIDIGSNITGLALLLVGVALFKAVSMFGHRYFVRMVAIRVSKELRERYFEHIQTLPMTFYHRYNIGSISSRVVTDALSVAEAINSCLLNYLQAPFTLVTTLALCVMTSWQLTVIIFCGFPLIVFPILYLAGKIKKVAKQIQKNQENFAQVLIDYLAGIQTVKIFNMEAFSTAKYCQQNEHMAALERKGAKYDLASRPIIHTIAMLFLVTSMLYGLYVLHMGVGELFFYCGLLYLFYEPIKKFAEENANILRGVAASERMFEVMALKPTHTDREDAVEFGGLKKSVRFDHVNFQYEEDRPILRDMSFTIKKGETVALVGPTGAGKSTVVALLPRLYEIDSGKILLDGEDLSSFTQTSVREEIAFVPQKPFLFLDTVAANIAFGREFSREEIIDAAKRAHAHEFIEQLPQGYDTPLEEAGKNLSGGQQQRLAIARALVKGGSILVLDEATSALDNVSERLIKDAIHELRGTITQVIIAHRLSTIEDADRIIYIDHGAKIAEGTREELLETCPQFQAMWSAHHQQAQVTA